MGEAARGRLRSGLGLAGRATAASHSSMESGEAPRTGADETGSVTTVPFEVVRRTEFVFEPFVGSLVQLPEVTVQPAQSSEFFLPQSPMQVVEGESPVARGAGLAVAWEKPQAARIAGAEENALAGVDLEKTAERESEKAEESLRLFEPKRIQPFDPITVTPQEGSGEEAAASQWNVVRRSSIEVPAELKAAIPQIDEQRRKRQEKKEKLAKEEKRGLLKAHKKSVEAQETIGNLPDLGMKAAKRTAGWKEVAEPATAGDSGKTADKKETAADPKSQPAKPASKVAAVAGGERLPWEVELAEALLARTQIPEEEETLKKKERLSLKMRVKRWLMSETVSLDGNRRRAVRMVLPGLVAFYWSGGTPRPHDVVNISRTGFYLRTNDLWSVETLVLMTLTRPRAAKKEKSDSISVLARVVRIDKSGVGHEFVTTEALTRARSLEVMPNRGTDWRELDRFLDVG